MESTLQQVMVDFQGDGVGEGELSWGQKEYWSTAVAEKTWGPLGGIKPLPAGTTVEQIADELRYLMSRYPPLRTRLRFEADGRPRQIVHGSGQIALEVVDAGESDPQATADAVDERFRRTDLDFTAEWPIRMAVVCRDGQPTHMVVLSSHLALDAAGAMVMMEEVAARRSTPAPVMQPLAQVAWQQSAAGRRQNASALRYWESVLRTVEPRTTVARYDSKLPRYWHGRFTSPTLLRALNATAERSGLGTSTVLLTVFAVALNRITGANPVVVRTIVSNRFRPGLSEVVCILTQSGLCVLDVADVPFDEALQRVRRSEFSALKHAYFDPEDLSRLRDRISRERGVDLDIAFHYNDRRTSAGPQDDQPQRDQPQGDRPDAAPRQLPDARGLPGTFEWVLGRDAPAYQPLFVHIDDTAEAIQITLHIDTRSFSREDAEALMRGMEELATDSV